MDNTSRLDKLIARLDSPYRAEAVTAAGKIYDHLQEHGGTWRGLFGSSRVILAPRNFVKRVRNAQRVVHFLVPSERQQLAQLELHLKHYAALAREDYEFLEDIFLRTGT